MESGELGREGTKERIGKIGDDRKGGKRRREMAGKKSKGTGLKERHKGEGDGSDISRGGLGIS